MDPTRLLCRGLGNLFLAWSRLSIYITTFLMFTFNLISTLTINGNKRNHFRFKYVLFDVLYIISCFLISTRVVYKEYFVFIKYKNVAYFSYTYLLNIFFTQ